MPTDDRRFAAAARLSEVNLNLYRSLVQPTVRALANPTAAEWMQKMHPLRLSYEMFSDANPFMRMVAGMAENVRKDRKPVREDNPFLAMQEQVSNQIVDSLEAFRESERKNRRTNVPHAVRPARTPGGARRRSGRGAFSPQGDRQSAASAADRAADRRAQGAYSRRRNTRGHHPRDSLCWNVAWLNGRAWLRDGAPSARSARRDVAF